MLDLFDPQHAFAIHVLFFYSSLLLRKAAVQQWKSRNKNVAEPTEWSQQPKQEAKMQEQPKITAASKAPVAWCMSQKPGWLLNGKILSYSYTIFS